MHLVFVTNELATVDNPSGGLSTFTLNISRLFLEHGHNVDIILVTSKEINVNFDWEINLYNIFIPKNEWEIYDEIGKEIYSEDNVNNRRTLINIYKAHKVKNLIDFINAKQAIDMVHFCNHDSLSLFFNYDIPYVIRISGFLNIISHGGDIINGSIHYTDNIASSRDKLEIIAMRRARYIISPSHLFADILENELGIVADVLESPYVLDTESWDSGIYKKLTERVERYILFYGTLRILKGIHVIAQIAYPFLESHKEFNIVLCGADTDLSIDGSRIKASEYVKKKAASYSDRVTYLGYLTREELYPVISGAELVVLPSRIENLSNACIESMAIGKIVVATEGASYEQLIEHGKSGFLCERDNAESYLQNIDKALSLSEKEKDNMIMAAKHRINELRPDKIYSNYLNYYQRIINTWNSGSMK